MMHINQEECPCPSPSVRNDPGVFIGSSMEGLDIARSLQLLLDHSCEAELWSQGLFEPGGSTLSSLVAAADSFDFAILVVSPDDTVVSRGTERLATRDNVVFELGLFMGKLGPERTFMVHDRTKKPDLPTDLAGVTPVTYRLHSSGKLTAALGPASYNLELAMRHLGPRFKPSSSSHLGAATSLDQARHSSEPASVRDTKTETSSESSLVSGQLVRLTKYSPAFARRLRRLHESLIELGYEARVPVKRSGSRRASYISYIDMRDGRNLGNTNSETFTFMRKGLRESLSGDPLVGGTRYATVHFSTEQAVDLVVAVAREHKL